MSGQSEMRRLIAEIDAHYFAARLVARGFAEGVAKHKFISARYNRIGKLNDRLAHVIGDEEKALDIVVGVMEGGIVQ